MTSSKNLFIILGLIALTILGSSPSVDAGSECKKSKLGTEYNGAISQTVNGRTCQNWKEQAPHKHKVFTNLPDGSEDAAKNFCRNPDNEPEGPWCYTTDPKVRWEYCSVRRCAECKKTKLGTEYNGVVSETINGRTCQNWKEQAPHKHKVFTNLPDGSEEAAGNYCRNPDKEPNGPWCYTTDSKVRWEYCDVKQCAECKKTKQGTEYIGAVSETVTGRTCQNWTSQVPHNHQLWTGLPEGSEKEAKNYCRNPDGTSDGPWCYTSEPKVRWEYCDVKFCAECKKTTLGTEYNGALAKTVSGLTCQRWASQEPHNHTVYTKFPDSNLFDALNYCRNPNGTAEGPWCYTTDKKVRWEFCDVKFCECKTTKPGTEYGGSIAHTVSGRNCQNWANQGPHNHKKWTDFPEGSQEAARNYCRNPDKTPDGPWCYTTDPNVRWELCDVKFC